MRLAGREQEGAGEVTGSLFWAMLNLRHLLILDIREDRQKFKAEVQDDHQGNKGR